MRAAAASIPVLRPGGFWRIAVPDAYFPKYLEHIDNFCENHNNCFVNSEWYQQHVRAGHTETIQHHMVVWSVDTLPQMFEVITFAHFQTFATQS